MAQCIKYLGFSENVLLHLCPLRCDSLHTHRQHSVRSGSRSFHDPSQRPSHHDHPHLPALSLLQTNRGAGRGGAQGTGELAKKSSFITCICYYLFVLTRNRQVLQVDLVWIWAVTPHTQKMKHVLSVTSAFFFCVASQIMLSCDARNTAWVSFDGRKRQEICHGDRLVWMPRPWYRHRHTLDKFNAPAAASTLKGFVM